MSEQDTIDKSKLPPMVEHMLSLEDLYMERSNDPNRIHLVVSLNGPDYEETVHALKSLALNSFTDGPHSDFGGTIFDKVKQSVVDYSVHMRTGSNYVFPMEDAQKVKIAGNVRHHIGNPVFSIETGLSSLRRRVDNTEGSETKEIMDAMERSLENIKNKLAEMESIVAAEVLI